MLLRNYQKTATYKSIPTILHPPLSMCKEYSKSLTLLLPQPFRVSHKAQVVNKLDSPALNLLTDLFHKTPTCKMNVWQIRAEQVNQWDQAQLRERQITMIEIFNLKILSNIQLGPNIKERSGQVGNLQYKNKTKLTMPQSSASLFARYHKVLILNN